MPAQSNRAMRTVARARNFSSSSEEEGDRNSRKKQATRSVVRARFVSSASSSSSEEENNENRSYFKFVTENHSYFQFHQRGSTKTAVSDQEQAAQAQNSTDNPRVGVGTGTPQRSNANVTAVKPHTADYKVSSRKGDFTNNVQAGSVDPGHADLRDTVHVDMHEPDSRCAFKQGHSDSLDLWCSASQSSLAEVDTLKEHRTLLQLTINALQQEYEDLQRRLQQTRRLNSLAIDELVRERAKPNSPSASDRKDIIFGRGVGHNAGQVHTVSSPQSLASANTIAWQMPNTEAAECTVPEGAKTAWVEDQDASGSVCYYPVTISVTGNPVHGLPLEGLVLSRMRAASDKERDTVVDQRGGTADLAVVHLASLVIFILLYTSAMFLLTA